MCGIAGIIALSNSSIDIKNNIQLMTKTIRHRGPDGEGFAFIDSENEIACYSNDTPKNCIDQQFLFSPKKNITELNSNFKIAFGHRRLSIIDLSAGGHQPMCSTDKSIWITYNGELYNYIELKKELELKGYQFQTNSDTEVIINSYIEWGTTCLERFNGMWSFVIYDKKNNQLFGSRDRFGVKPFYYYKNNDAFVFASEIKAIVKLPFVNTEINKQAVFDFFVSNKMEVEEEGMFKNIFELFPSNCFVFNLSTHQLKIWKYYNLKVNESEEKFNSTTFNTICSNTKFKLIEAIDLRLRSDVAVGSCLSGGIDSSAIVGIMHQLNQSKKIDNLKLFTASFKNSSVDESNWAKLVAEKTNAEWHQTFPTSAELFNDLENLIYSQDIPIWSTSTYAQHRVMKIANEQGIKVVLDGQGGDELFAGYPHHQLKMWMTNAKKINLHTAIKQLKESDINAKSIRNLFKHQLFNSSIKWMAPNIQLKLYSTYFNDFQYLNKEFIESHKSSLKNTEVSPNSLNGLLANEFSGNKLKVFLKCEDRASMWHSVESRTPFADDIKLIEYGFQIPSVYKTHKGISKYILREATKEFLPNEIYQRKDKMGFVTPNKKWLKELNDELKPLFNDSLSDYFDIKHLQKNYTNFIGLLDQKEEARVFKFITFAVWKKKFEL